MSLQGQIEEQVESLQKGETEETETAVRGGRVRVTFSINMSLNGGEDEVSCPS